MESLVVVPLDRRDQRAPIEVSVKSNCEIQKSHLALRFELSIKLPLVFLIPQLQLQLQLVMDAIPPGLTPIELVKNGVSSIYTYTVFATITFCIQVQLFAFSTPQTRRLPVFWILNLSIVLGYVACITSGLLEASSMYEPNNAAVGNVAVWVVSDCILFFIPLVTDCSLPLRILAFYPPQVASWQKRAAVIAFPVLMKIPRLIVVSMFTNVAVQNSSGGIAQAATALTHQPYAIIEWSMQLADTGYCTAFLLWKLHTFGSSNFRSKSLAAIIKRVAYTVLGTFFIPVCLTTAVIVCQASGLPPLQWSNTLVANVYVSVIGAVFCTLWSTIFQTQGKMTQNTSSDSRLDSRRNKSSLFITSNPRSIGSMGSPLGHTPATSPTKNNFFTDSYPLVETSPRASQFNLGEVPRAPHSPLRFDNAPFQPSPGSGIVNDSEGAGYENRDGRYTPRKGSIRFEQQIDQHVEDRDNRHHVIGMAE